MIQLSLQFQRKTKVPTKNFIIHQFRSDWKTVLVLRHDSIKQMLHHFNSSAPIKNDAQLCYWMYKNMGIGIYSIKAWGKGRKGFWSFMKVQLFDDGYLRLPRNQSQTDKEKDELISEYKRMNRNLKHAEDDEHKGEIKEEIENLKEELEITEEISELESPAKYGPYPFIKSIQPVYKFHEYETLDMNPEPVSQGSKEEVKEYKLW